MTTPSPLGRYGTGSEGETLHRVQLLNTPVRVLLAGREHHDELMRECSLLALGQQDVRELSDRLRALIDVLGVRYGIAVARPDELVEAAVEHGKATVNLTFDVPAHFAQAAETMDRLMIEADEFCGTEQLMTLARGPVLAAFGHWYAEQVSRQIAGHEPQPWDGPLEV